jgi:ribosome-associated protein
MIQITDHLSIDEADIQVDFVQSSGPGGQNVNKVATLAQLRYNTAALPEDVRTRLLSRAGGRITGEGILIIHARRYRTQDQNRQDAINRLVELIRAAALPPTPRHATRPTLASRKRRLETKRRRGAVKRLRSQPPPDNDGL